MASVGILTAMTIPSWMIQNCSTTIWMRRSMASLMLQGNGPPSTKPITSWWQWAPTFSTWHLGLGSRIWISLWRKKWIRLLCSLWAGCILLDRLTDSPIHLKCYTFSNFVYRRPSTSIFFCRHVNSGRQESKINLIYSTPSCYLKEVNRAGLSLEVKRDDFFPYASSKHSFWTGYFTSRPALKFFIHQTNNFLQACKHFAANRESNERTLEKVFDLAEPMAVAQHHDAVSGTAKQHVTFDYALRLSHGIKSCEEVIGNRIK